MALKGEFSVKRNLLVKAFAYPRGSVELSQKSAKCEITINFLTVMMPQIQEILPPNS